MNLKIERGGGEEGRDDLQRFCMPPVHALDKSTLNFSSEITKFGNFRISEDNSREYFSERSELSFLHVNAAKGKNS